MAELSLTRDSLRLRRVLSVTVGDREKGVLYPGSRPETPILLYAQKGALHCTVDGRKRTLQPGELLVCRAGCFVAYFSDLELTPHFLSMGFESGQTVEVEWCAMASPREQALLDALMDEWEQRAPGWEDAVFGAACQTLTLLDRRQDKEPLRQPTGQEGEYAIIRRAQMYIRDQVRKKLSVPQTARLTGVSPSYLAALFQKHLGIAPGEYIRRAKLQESRKMIREGGMTFTQIAAALEYSTVYQFSRQFKEKYSMTPTEYARSVEEKGSEP